MRFLLLLCFILALSTQTARADPQIHTTGLQDSAIQGSQHAGMQDTRLLETLIAPYVLQQSGLAPDKSKVVPSPIDPRLQLPACPAPEAFTPPGSKFWGRTTVGVRCNQPVWSIYVPTQVLVYGPIVMTARALARGQILQAQDLLVEQGELTSLGTGLLNRPEDAIGKFLLGGLPPHFPLRANMLRAPQLVCTGQIVKLSGESGGISVSNQGKAMANGTLGERIPIKLNNGRIIYGTISGSGIATIEF